MVVIAFLLSIFGWLLRRITARGSSAGFSRVSPTKVEDPKSFLKVHLC